MIQLELGKYYIDRNYDVIAIINITNEVRLVGGAFTELFIGIKLNETLDFKDREFYCFDIDGNEYEKEYKNSPYQMVAKNSIIDEDNRNVIIADNYLAYKTEAIKGLSKPTYQDYTIDSIDLGTNKISFQSAVSAKVGQFVWVKSADTGEYVKTPMYINSIENGGVDVVLSQVIDLDKDDIVQFRDAEINKKIYCNLNLLPQFELNEEELTLKIGNDEIDLGSWAKMMQIKKYLGVLSEVFK